MEMDRSKVIACVTGATGMVGRRIVQRLLSDGYKVRALSRQGQYRDPRVELLSGGLDDEGVLRRFVCDAHLLFHCAAELHDTSKMWDVNVQGTERLLNMVRESTVKYLCYLSSAGVVGRTKAEWVDENSECSPQNTYEKSKLAAEKLVSKGLNGCNVVILRPTNVISEDRPGALGLPMSGSWLSHLKVFLKGGECAHIVHAEDVAEAAVYFISQTFNSPQCYFVSCDHEPLNTYAGVRALYEAMERGRSTEDVRPALHLPLILPHVLRLLWKGRGNRGDVRYSSKKLLSSNCVLPLGLVGGVKKIVESIGGKNK